MEYVRGQSGAELLREHGHLGVDETLSLVAQACLGLQDAHRHGVVHRDVKPGNLLRAEDGVTKLADFGIAKAADDVSGITQVGSVLGTAAYLAPEQAHGEAAGPAADIYALGVVTYQLLSGRLPYDAQSLTELVLKQQSEPPPRLDHVVAGRHAGAGGRRRARDGARPRGPPGLGGGAAPRAGRRRPRRRRRPHDRDARRAAPGRRRHVDRAARRRRSGRRRRRRRRGGRRASRAGDPRARRSAAPAAAPAGLDRARPRPRAPAPPLRAAPARRAGPAPRCSSAAGPRRPSWPRSNDNRAVQLRRVTFDDVHRSIDATQQLVRDNTR